MTPRLKSLTIRDFRSVRGEIHVPLDAPVVLIHGANGVGKTSTLSALELGLTGEVASLARMGRDYAAHLLHKEAGEGWVVAAVDGLPAVPLGGHFTIGSAGASGQRLLSADAARFYVERSFLSQATLGRLLEIYQVKDATGSGSPLTRFVKDLLRLDKLDALIDGLHDSEHVTRLRASAPTFWSVRGSVPEVTKALAQQSTAHEALGVELERSRSRLHAALARLGIDPALSEEALAVSVATDRQEVELQRLAVIRREVVATREQWRSLEAEVDPVELASAETDAERARRAADAWTAAAGAAVAATLATVTELLPAAEAMSAAGIAQAWNAAHEAVAAELVRCNEALKRDEAASKALKDIELELERARARLAVLEDQIGARTALAGDVAEALSKMLPHLHADDCPVCGRDFGEVSQTPLHLHVSASLAKLTEDIGRLQALSQERAEAVRTISTRERAAAEMAGSRLADVGRQELSSRRARLDDLARKMDDLIRDVAEGEDLAVHAAESARRLVDLRSRGPQLSYVRSTAEELASRLGIDVADFPEALSSLLGQVGQALSTRNDVLLRTQADRVGAAAELAEFRKHAEAVRDSAARLEAQERRLERLQAALDASEEKRLQAKRLAGHARDARTKVVRKVFNDTLNSIWHDLFVRLAPEEPFVPAFVLPESSSGPVEAALETRYRSNRQGGDPRAMLSAGNLNTAALTLFLALHLSVAPTLPWLVIDDPVQSMDEVHIAQFAALLRTLSKQHGRQVIVAVHERPLFEYLALELSPAFAGDRLLTVELGRSSSGKTTCDPTLLSWAPDSAVAA